MPNNDQRWWDQSRFRRFLDSMRPIHAHRLEGLRRLDVATWATAYRRTRNGEPVWEIRADDLSGCLRTARGGSSRQAIVEAGGGEARARWMTLREYARLQGAPNYKFDGVSPNVCLSAFGDAVCVPVVRWITRHCLLRLLEGHRLPGTKQSSQLFPRRLVRERQTEAKFAQHRSALPNT
jgi:DNA (cytosine-5)-methyltransferase 1